MRSTTGRLRFQPSRPAPSLPHQVPNEHAENAGIPRASTAKKSLALDPLENQIPPGEIIPKPGAMFPKPAETFPKPGATKSKPNATKSKFPFFRVFSFFKGLRRSDEEFSRLLHFYPPPRLGPAASVGAVAIFIAQILIFENLLSEKI